MINHDFEKSQIQNEIEEKRKSLTRAIDDLKSNVHTEVQTRREAVTQLFDWKYHVKKNPTVSCGVAIAAGYFAGKKINSFLHKTNSPSSLSPQSLKDVRSNKSGLLNNITDLLMRETFKTAQNMIIPMVIGAISGKLTAEANKPLSPQSNESDIDPIETVTPIDYGNDIL